MAHQAQKDFFDKVKKKFPKHFENVSVIDFGSLDVNGSLKDLFKDSKYIGVDIHDGKNVDVISKVHEFKNDQVDTIVSGEMLEHDQYWLLSLLNMYYILKEGGLMAISAAGPLRGEHGTKRTGDEWGTSPDYYENMTEEKFNFFIKELNRPFKEYKIEIGNIGHDIYFYGIK